MANYFLLGSTLFQRDMFHREVFREADSFAGFWEK
jgi:hypothetical protein